jgi:hypothetical protein
MGKIFFYFILVSILVVYSAQSQKKAIAISRENDKNLLVDTLFSKMAVNNIEMWFSNEGTGSFIHSTQGAGLFFPKGSGNFLSYGDGPFIAGMVNGDLRISGVKYHYTSFQPGPAINGIPDTTPKNIKIYQIRKDWEALPEGPEKNKYKDDYFNWISDLGAPNTIDASGNRIPKFIGDEQAWFVMNDFNPIRTNSFFATDPIGVEVQCLVWAYKSPHPLENIIFRKFTFINKGNNDLNNAYLACWADPDVGVGNNNYYGCDTLLDLAYVYYSTNYIDKYYGKQIPAIGYAIMQGPIIKSENEKANWNFGKKAGYKNLNMTSSVSISHDWDPFCDCDVLIPIGSKSGGVQMYNLMKGLKTNGNPFINSLLQPVKYVFPGDPVTNTGWIDGVKNQPVLTPRDVMILPSCGPFNFMKKDTQEFVFAIVIGDGADRLSSITIMKNYTKLIKEGYDNQFNNLSISLSAEETAFYAQQFGKLPEEKNITINNPVNLSLLWVATVDSLWLNVTPDNENSKKIIIKINSTNLSKGLHTANITLKMMVENYEFYKKIKVNYLIDTEQPKISINPDTVKFSAVKNSQSGFSKSFFLRNTGGGKLYWQITNTAGWMNVTPLSGINDTTITVNINTTDLPPGTYSSILNINSPFASNTPINVNIKYTIDPFVSGDTIKVTKKYEHGEAYPIIIDRKNLSGHTYEITFDTSAYIDDYGNEKYKYFWKLTDKTAGIEKARSENFSGSGEYPVFDGIYLKVIGDTKTGIRTDDDPLQRGWVWEPGSPDGSNRFIDPQTWANYSLDCFGLFTNSLKSLGYANTSFFSGSSVKPHELKKVEVRFSSNPGKQQYAYRYLRKASQPAAMNEYTPYIKNKSGTYPYQDYVTVPFTVWDVESNPQIQLSCGFMENNEIKPSGNVDGRWRPTVDGSGGREFLFIFNSPYSVSPESKYQVDIISTTTDMLYWGIFRERGADFPFPNDSGANVEAKLIIYPYYTIALDNKISFSAVPNSIKEEVKNKPISFNLNPNYPNPFNPETTIEFSIPVNSFVELKVFNMLGSEVTTLISGNMKAGIYKTKWVASSVSSGVYFLNLKAGGKNVMRKIVLLK